MEMNKIYQMDCFDGMKSLEDKTVDLVLTDPPYNVKLKEQISLKGRKALYKDFDEMDWDKLNIKEMYEKLFRELDRIVKADGSAIIFCRIEWITHCIEAAQKNNFDVKATIIWHKVNPTPQVRKRNYLSSIETIVWLARWDKDKCLFKFNFKGQNEMHNFVEMPICQGNERTEHPTQKPLKLMQRFVRIHSNKDDLILDPFTGSGTTAVASKRLGRNYIGFELNPKYVKIANERLASTGLFKEEAFSEKSNVTLDRWGLYC